MKAIELFCGAGGLSEGFRMAGFEIKFGLDIDKDSIETFSKNHPEAVWQLTDIRKIDSIGYGRGVDVLLAGPPCQGFSTLGKRFIDDPRNYLYKEYMRLLKQIRPKWIVMENVPGLLNLAKGKFAFQILEDYSDIGYAVKMKVLNAADYGVPQTRKRVIFIGNRINKKISFPKRNVSKYKTVGEAFSNMNRKLYNNEKPNHTSEIVKMMAKIPQGSSKFEVFGKGYRFSYIRLHPDRPSPTVCTAPTFIHPFEHRHITPREAARLQSFPDSYVFEGSRTSVYRQIGNAVPPLMAKAIAETIKNA